MKTLWRKNAQGEIRYKRMIFTFICLLVVIGLFTIALPHLVICNCPFLKVPRSGGEPGIFLIFSFIFSHNCSALDHSVLWSFGANALLNET